MVVVLTCSVEVLHGYSELTSLLTCFVAVRGLQDLTREVFLRDGTDTQPHTIIWLSDTPATETSFMLPCPIPPFQYYL